MDNDDQQVGRILSRREALALFGAAGASLLVGCGASVPNAVQPTSVTGQAAATGATATAPLNAEAATAVVLEGNPTAVAATAVNVATVEAGNASALPACVVRPELTEGPYFVDTQLNRSDIRSEPSDNTVKAGVPMQVTMNVSRVSANGCTPLAGAIVDIWHCDALGVYSGVTDNSQGFDTTGQQFLRGQQTTDAQGVVQFTTIYPGWYSGRAVHIHFKVQTDAGNNQAYEFTSQFFFDDALSDQVLAQAPYTSKGQRDTLNSDDGIYQGGGDQLVLALTPTNQGYTSTFDIALDLSDADTGGDDGGGGSGGRGGPGGPPPGGRPSGPPARGTAQPSTGATAAP